MTRLNGLDPGQCPLRPDAEVYTNS